MPLCPICGKEYSKSWLERHVDLCLDHKERRELEEVKKRREEKESKERGDNDPDHEDDSSVPTPKRSKISHNDTVLNISQKNHEMNRPQSSPIHPTTQDVSTEVDKALIDHAPSNKITKPYATKEDALKFIQNLRDFSNTHKIEELDMDDFLIDNNTHSTNDMSSYIKYNKIIYSFLRIIKQIKNGRLNLFKGIQSFHMLLLKEVGHLQPLNQEIRTQIQFLLKQFEKFIPETYNTDGILYHEVDEKGKKKKRKKKDVKGNDINGCARTDLQICWENEGVVGEEFGEDDIIDVGVDLSKQIQMRNAGQGISSAPRLPQSMITASQIPNINLASLQQQQQNHPNVRMWNQQQLRRNDAAQSQIPVINRNDITFTSNALPNSTTTTTRTINANPINNASITSPARINPTKTSNNDQLPPNTNVKLINTNRNNTTFPKTPPQTKINPSQAIQTPQRPSKPLNAFTYYCRVIKPQLRASLKNVTEAEIHSETIKRWRCLADKDKNVYLGMSERDHVRFEKEMKAYNEFMTNGKGSGGGGDIKT